MNHPVPSPAPRRRPTPPGARRVVIVGGGFAGASAAIQLVRGSTLPLSVTIIDPAERAGRGLAYQALDGDPCDVILVAGQAHCCDRDTRLIVQALDEARLRIE